MSRARDAVPFSFYPNLKPYTYNRGPGNRRFDGYLLSREYLGEHRALGARALADGRVLFLDNGLLDDARTLAGKRLPRSDRKAMELVARWQRERDAEAVSVLAASEMLGVEDVWSSIRLTHGAELDAEHLGRLTSHAQWSKRWGERLGPDVRVFMPVHVKTFAEARAAGRVLGKQGLAIALPLTRVLQSNKWHTSLAIDRVLTWDKKLPGKYLELVPPLLGLLTGYREAAGHAPRVHALGLGTPILLPIVAAAVCGSGGVLSSDSMAPINDGMTEPTTSLYVATPAPLKFKAFKIAQAWIEGRPWGCSCPFCTSLEARYPTDIERARRRWLESGKEPLGKEDLLSKGVYAKDFPLLAWSRDVEQHSAVGLARTNHNLWVLQRVEQQIRQAARNGIERWVDGVIERHATRADPTWSDAARRAWDAIRGWLARG